MNCATNVCQLAHYRSVTSISGYSLALVQRSIHGYAKLIDLTLSPRHALNAIAPDRAEQRATVTKNMSAYPAIGGS
jgi:hypothetical protein